MSNIVYIFLTILMVLDCILLVFLVLLQLPKKEAGAGMAFGGAATDALFGAGSGNVLTKITKYVAGIFFALAIVLAFLAAHQTRTGAASLNDELMKTSATPVAPIAPPATVPGSAPASGFLQLTNTIPAAPSQTAPPPAAGTNR
jgi:preprotein translocase subunit SecG